MSEDVPSIRDLTRPKTPRGVPRVYPEGVRFSKRWVLFKTAWVGVALIIIAFFLMGFASSLSPEYYWDPSNQWSDSWVIKPSQEWYHSWTFKEPVEGKLLEINVSVSGGNNDLRIYIDTPKGRMDYGKLTSPIHIKVNVTKYGAGKYTIHYDNSFSVITSKSVSVIETAYVLKEDTTDKEVLYFTAIVLLLIPGLILIGAGTRKVATLVVDDDVIEAKLVARGKLELRVNNYKLDQRLDHAVKFKAGTEENRIVEIKPVKHGWNTLGWEFYVDDQEVGRLP
ncbi:MAG TPA: hypothetical protein ENL40_01075 [Thermococcus litoralis]|uniref:Uncharacterized protein n=1 Tax=Thermococcus litoralis TaxID=2265 RepID=A0A7C5NRV8_THELI|nr:hypothetical protein [Thermococcus litoralis]